MCGRPSEQWGQEVVAIVQLRAGGGAGADARGVAARRGRAATSPATSCPKAFVFVDDVVRSPAGKADYRWAKALAATTDD